MKYVRTNEGIYQIKDEKIYQDILKNMFYEATNYEHIYLEEIVKESDKLEKLFDRYVLNGVDIIFINKDKTKYRFENEDDWWYDIREIELRNGIYGAIWTKGEDGEPILKSVAKMNTEGELELV